MSLLGSVQDVLHNRTTSRAVFIQIHRNFLHARKREDPLQAFEVGPWYCPQFATECTACSGDEVRYATYAGSIACCSWCHCLSVLIIHVHDTDGQGGDKRCSFKVFTRNVFCTSFACDHYC